MYDMFCNCENLTNLDVSHFNTSNVTDMNSMFRNCEKLTNLNVYNFDVRKVESVVETFEDCKSLQSLDISSWHFDVNPTRGWTFSGCSMTVYVNEDILEIVNHGAGSGVTFVIKEEE